MIGVGRLPALQAGVALAKARFGRGGREWDEEQEGQEGFYSWQLRSPSAEYAYEQGQKATDESKRIGTLAERVRHNVYDYDARTEFRAAIRSAIGETSSSLGLSAQEAVSNNAIAWLGYTAATDDWSREKLAELSKQKYYRDRVANTLVSQIRLEWAQELLAREYKELVETQLVKDSNCNHEILNIAKTQFKKNPDDAWGQSLISKLAQQGALESVSIFSETLTNEVTPVLIKNPDNRWARKVLETLEKRANHGRNGVIKTYTQIAIAHPQSDWVKTKLVEAVNQLKKKSFESMTYFSGSEDGTEIQLLSTELGKVLAKHPDADWAKEALQGLTDNLQHKIAVLPDYIDFVDRNRAIEDLLPGYQGLIAGNPDDETAKIRLGLLKGYVKGPSHPARSRAYADLLKAYPKVDWLAEEVEKAAFDVNYSMIVTLPEYLAENLADKPEPVWLRKMFKRLANSTEEPNAKERRRHTAKALGVLLKKNPDRPWAKALLNKLAKDSDISVQSWALGAKRRLAGN